MKFSSAIALSLASAPLAMAGGSYKSTPNPEYEIDDYKLSKVSTSEDVKYVCKFENLWTAPRHPYDYPWNAHWSSPYVISHSSDYTLFAEGEDAGQGVIDIAERGNPDALQAEMAASDDVLHYKSASVFYFLNIEETGDAANVGPVDFSGDYPYMSSISMVAPSPDWFSGVSNFDMTYKGYWYESISLLLPPWDSGTDAGQFYVSDNMPGEGNPVYQITPETVPESGAFLKKGKGKKGKWAVEPVVRLECEMWGYGY